jgi:putative transposase
MQWKCWPREVYGVARLDANELSPKARERLRALDLWREVGSAALVCRVFGVSRASLYRWRRQFDPRNLRSLEDRSKRPKRVRRATWEPSLIEAVERLRKTYPRWGKEKLACLVANEGHSASESTVGRILQDLKRRRVLPELRPWVISSRKRGTHRYAVRKPKDYQVAIPGDLVELDTLDVRPLPGIVMKSFTARDCVSRWDVLEIHAAATATNAQAFLKAVLARTPFPVRAFQVDGGSEFKAGFETACRNLNIPLFVLPPKSPKLNGHVERANRTHTEEFYELYDGPWTVAAITPALFNWERIYNTVRPHHSLKNATPFQFLFNRGIITTRASPYLSHMY